MGSALSCCACGCCGLCSSAAGKITQRSARIAYCGLFALSLIIAWIMREISAPLMRKISWINTSSSTTRSDEWLEMQAVLRVSSGSFLFYTLFALVMIGVKDRKDWRDSLHHGAWTAKLIGWFILTVLMFFLPNGVMIGYGILSIVGSGLFLLVQVIILLDFTHNWNAAWVAKDEQFWYAALLFASVVCYLGTFTLSGLLYYWFSPSGETCSLNVFFITMTLILAVGYCVISLHPKVNGSLLPASVISLYCAYVCYTGLSSEPRTYECNGLHNHSAAVSTSTLILGMLTTVLSVVYSAVRAGSSTTFLSPPSSPRGGSQALLESGSKDEENEKDESRPVAYVYSFFHIIFALATMYSGMLLTGWTTAGNDSEQLVDVGWPSVWVRICTEWITGGLFVWSLVAPLIFPDREF
ncbi:hypothetical protein KP509_10G006400 [Ceratopteris richardii]|uniref:Serine incorporator n=1 Tax=Ceratopteris richardii TaxID=49495 RepID=A0A8T2TYA7_CERRI|nr:hypothetical protein KP509_10G006400 [Ceratopteris richardii]